MNEKQADGKKNSESKGFRSDINYREIAWHYAERANQHPEEWFEASDYLEDVCQELGYDPEQVKANKVGLELTWLEGNLFESKKPNSSSAKLYRFAPWRETYQEEGAPEKLKEKLVEVLAEEEDKLTPLGVRANYEDQLAGAHAIAIKRALDELAEEGKARRSRVMYEVVPAQERNFDDDIDPAVGKINTSQELKKIASQLDENELPADILQVDSRFFRGLGGIQRREVDEDYAKRNIETYRGAEDHERGIMMEIAGELVEMSLDPNMEESWKYEIAEVIENNFPQKEVSRLEADLKLKFGKDVESEDKG